MDDGMDDSMDDSTDFYRWMQKQADALRRRAGDELDWDGLADERNRQNAHR